MSEPIPEALKPYVTETDDGLRIAWPESPWIWRWLPMVGLGTASIGCSGVFVLGFLIAGILTGEVERLASAMSWMAFGAMMFAVSTGGWAFKTLLASPRVSYVRRKERYGTANAVYLDTAGDETVVGIRTDDAGSREILRLDLHSELQESEALEWLAARAGQLLGVEVVDLRDTGDRFASDVTNSRFAFEDLHAVPAAPMSDVAFDHHGLKTTIGPTLVFDGTGVVEPYAIPLRTIRAVEPRFRLRGDTVVGQLGFRTDTAVHWLGGLDLEDTGRERGAAHLNWLAAHIRAAAEAHEPATAAQVPAALEALRNKEA